MKEEIKIPATGEVFEVETAPITLVVPGPQCPKLEYPGRVEINPLYGIYHIERVQSLHNETRRYLLDVFPHIAIEKDTSIPNIISLGDGVKTLAGMLNLSLLFRDMGIRFVLQYPETCLHPTAQANLGNVIMSLMRGSPEK
jgi:hypothetical protein